jgi:MFS family permease
MPNSEAPRPARGGLPFYSRYTRALHLRAEILNNLFAGCIGLAGAVARKGLDASDAGITVLTTAGSASLLTAVFWSHVMEGRPKRPFIVGSALAGRLALVLMAFVVEPKLFVALWCVYFLSEPVFIPAQNALLQANYHPSIRGTVFGSITAVTKLVFLAAAYGSGELLDARPEAYRWLFPAAGLIGTLAYLQYARIRIRRWEAPAREAARPGLLSAVRNFGRIMREDRDFDRFERNFMLYGIAFMIVLPVNVFLLIDDLRMSYGTYSLCTLVTFHVVVAVLSRPAGALMDRIGATRVAALSFLTLIGYSGALFAASLTNSVALAFVGYVFFGVGMSGVNAAWSLGAMKFAGDRDASAYMGAHVACVGARGLFGPGIGFALMLAVEHPWVGLVGWGIPSVYAVAMVLMSLAAAAMWRLGKRESRGGSKAPAARASEDRRARVAAAP